MPTSMMSPSRRLSLAVLAGLVVLALPSLPVVAAGSASSASLGGMSASVGSVSTSIEQSSKSSSGDNKTAEGPYRIIDVADAPAQPGGAPRVRLTLQPTEALPAGTPGFVLVLPQTTYLGARLGTGDVVLATGRDYGLEFARADTREAFFLVVDDAWQRDLKTRALRG
jgi:hypothetical protein